MAYTQGALYILGRNIAFDASLQPWTLVLFNERELYPILQSSASPDFDICLCIALYMQLYSHPLRMRLNLK